VVSTDCPSGPSEILENGRWGRLVSVGDVKELAQAIDEGLSAVVNREALMRRAADFSPEIAARKYLDLLDLNISKKLKIA
jgi:glycosyltransferase involved in cell wall biosynthesis